MAAAPDRTRYGAVARALHWTTAAAVAVLIPTGVLMTSAPLADVADPLFIAHKGLGSILLILLAARLAWRIGDRPPPLPATVPQRQRTAMHLTHGALYALLVTMVVSGYVRTAAGGFPIELLDALGIPPLMGTSPGAERVALVVHQIAAYGLVGLVAAHLTAAFHDLLLADGRLFRRMRGR